MLLPSLRAQAVEEGLDIYTEHPRLFLRPQRLRLLQRDVPLSEVARRFLPVIWPVVAILLLTGSLLIIGEPRRSLLNATFYLKMALLVVAVLLTAGLQWSFASAAAAPGSGRARLIAGQVMATASILVWCGVLFAGRWIAYTQAG